jgi:hypothetical protein
MPLKTHLLAESHRRQFNGEDYQAVAIELAEANGIEFEQDEFTELESSPEPGCDCGFCATAPWPEPDYSEGHDCPAGNIDEIEDNGI